MAQETSLWRRNAVLHTSAWREALRVSSARLEPEHLFLGLLASGGPAARLAAHHGLPLAAARRGAAVQARRQLRAIGRDVAREGIVPRAPLAALDPGGATGVPLSEAAEPLRAAARGEDSEFAWALTLLDEPSGVVSGLARSAEADLEGLRAALTAAAVSAEDSALPGARLGLTPSSCPVPHDALTPPDGIRTTGAAAERPARLSAIGAEWFVAAPLDAVLELLQDPAQIRLVTAQADTAEVDDAYGVVTTVTEKDSRGTVRRTTRQLFPSEPAADRGSGVRRIRWAEISDRHHLGLLDENGVPLPDERDFTGALTGLFDFTLIPDTAPQQDLPQDYPGHFLAAREGTRVQLVRARRVWGRLDALASRATRWQQAWAVAQHLSALSALAAEEH